MTERKQAPEATDAPTKAPAVGSQVDLVLGAWQPIATAPKNGAEILAWREDAG